MSETNAVEQLNEYARQRQTAKVRRDSALEEAGIGSDVEGRLSMAFEHIAQFCANLQQRACGQAVYDALNNVPFGILSQSEPIGKHALRIALVGAAGQMVKWDVIEALELAADIAEDVNAHPEAAKIRQMAVQAKGSEVTP